MVKKLPLTRRLEVALQSVSSDSEQKIVYGKLAEFVENNLEIDDTPDSFYQKINSETLIPDGSTYNKDIIEKGKSLCDYLTQSITLPTPQETPRYRKKMIDAMRYEFECLKEYSENE